MAPEPQVLFGNMRWSIAAGRIFVRGTASDGESPAHQAVCRSLDIPFPAPSEPEGAGLEVKDGVV